MHDLILLLLHLSVRVVRREDQIDLSAQRVDAHDPVVGGVHLLLQAVRVVQELLVELGQDQLQFYREDVLGHQVAELHR